MQEKKQGKYYLLIGSPVQDGVSSADRNSVRGRAPGVGGSNMRQETQEDDKQCRKVKFLLSQETFLSRSRIEMITAPDIDGIKRPDSTLMFSYP